MDLTDLYQEVILDHGKNPRNRREMPDHTHVAEGYNPMCGDQIKVWLKVRADVVEDASFSGQGCAISQASASMMTQAILGKDVAAASELFDVFRWSVTDGGQFEECDHDAEVRHEATEMDERLGELNSLVGVKKYPNRIKCATLAWHAMHSALEEKAKVTTE